MDLAIQIHSTVFCNEMKYVGTVVTTPAPGSEYGSDLADTLIGNRRHGFIIDLPPLLCEAPYMKSICPPAPGIELGTDRVGAYLSGYIRLKCGVDSRHLRVLRYDLGVVWYMPRPS